MKVLRRLVSCLDAPLYRDWLTWVVVAVTIATGVKSVGDGGPWALLGAPVAFLFYAWVLGAARNLVRGYRDDDSSATQRP